ncbi:uncharacterized protein CANTADRAFT_92142 [Suhomyces tanzawaensis NRRL Y-17324]|uniref:Uncharacterized protein n=1 Tax=Suhomyces tanzawaensis NRRL Y-17324 TaxID=984487 RepID=A0A1E4SBW7_9ASCO|nr:uncharacterized protein CANTADRAFT_92142 [Suhomyces tanzawaensis NRRL Y-17324]ODV76991.1 hypothetical protein CANTADRAFT_92142 [Suhomyces tanzawaensis NRRL Y-17324]
MFNRRRSRLEPAYTGVNHTAPASSQPSSNALAAALTIGEAMKLGAHQPTKTVQRSNSMQYIIKPAANQPTRSTSLLKRSPSLSSAAPAGQKQQFRGFSSSSITSSTSRSSVASPPPARARTPQKTHQKIVYDIDDSIDDSYLDDITEEANQRYFNNHDNMKDLRLSHQPLSPPAPKSAPKKMVKKYIPTPNGIKIIEVPEENLNKEISRNNSIRSGSNIPRTGSLRAPPKKTIRTSSLNSLSGKKPSSRLSSLVNSPNMTSMTENVELEDSLGQIDSSREHELKLQALEKQIQHEKDLARDLEIKKLEFEKLKLARLENEKKMLLLEEEAERASNPNDALENGLVKVTSDKTGGEAVTSTITRETFETPSDNSESKDQISKPLLASVDDHELSDDEGVAGVSIDGSHVVVDELEKKKIETTGVPETPSDHLQKGSTPEYGDSSEYDTDREAKDLATGSTSEIGIINRYGDFNTNELSNRDSIIEHPLAISTDDEDDTESNRLAKQLRPTFDVVPEIIEDAQEDALVSQLDALQVPPPINGGSSGSSLHSVSTFESKSSLKKPIKSAMKNSNSFSNISTTSSKANANAARDAYLSLTTAENTKLNSKLSSSQLNDLKQNHTFIPLSDSSANGNNRMSQTLRKQPSQKSQGGLAGRSLRPQSMSADPRITQQQNNNGGMSGRSLRNSMYTPHVAPMAPHPALQENYQSPSKLKAAELYAKANARPKSVFKPIKRTSSFSKEAEHQPQQPQRQRTTMRDSQPTVNPQQHRIQSQQPSKTPQPAPPAPANNGFQKDNFRSRFYDSDEGETHDSRRNGGFSSRFNDSDDEGTQVSGSVSSPVSHHADGSATLRESTKPSKSAGKEKKKFGKLRKLFGRSN